MRRFLDHDMRVGSAETERADAGNTSVLDRGPLDRAGWDAERYCSGPDVRVQLREVQVRRNLPVRE